LLEFLHVLRFPEGLTVACKNIIKLLQRIERSLIVVLSDRQGRPSHGKNEAEIFIIYIFQGEEIFLVYDTIAQFLSLRIGRRNV